MPYIGLTLYIEEAVRLLNLDPTIIMSYYQTEPVQKYLREQGSKLVFEYVDKGVCVLGIPFPYTKYHPQMIEIDKGIQTILELKAEFQVEVKKLELDLSEVIIAQMESDSIKMKNPEPFLCLW